MAKVLALFALSLPLWGWVFLCVSECGVQARHLSPSGSLSSLAASTLHALPRRAASAASSHVSTAFLSAPTGNALNLSSPKPPFSSPASPAPAIASAVAASQSPTPAVAIPEAVVDGELVNGKSVRDWKVERSLYQALHMALAEEMDRDRSVCVMGEDVGHYGGSYKVTRELHARFGNFRCMDTPICENTFTGMAVGAAMNGLRPVVEGMNMGFLLLAFNQISNNAGMVRYTSGGAFDVPIVIRGPGGVGKQLGPEHSQRIEAYLMAVPGLKIVACSTPYNARGLLKSAIRENNPVVFFEHVLTYNIKEEIPLLPYTLPLDKAEVPREGKDVTVLAYGKLRHVALEAAEQLAGLGLSAEVVDLISLKPLDMATIQSSIRKTGRCIILDESSRTGGIGGEIFAQVMENCADDLLEVPVRLATKDIPTPYAAKLEEATIVTPEDVVNSALWLVSKRGPSAQQASP
ncbi:pyruvate dehydrogenase complex subunit PD-HE1Beta [Besnoitia besnoiti]|uniref:Pyruvate dehydrogenase complex subunit PD-HE1Beta n=1 Tax=Besnoitia besnoiti TaxID=94643 RepID=A0A2A9M5B0_BESBE|nr:pyruvate dehydrogenase complex subunit PD-HE1Beta [Besnoitia besnoiti]PFH31096.1 pyruvate dehydrogenase complex subunit PD-HE1Beta [Besnoitia besnoiti]